MTDSQSHPEEQVVDQEWALIKTEQVINQVLTPPCCDCMISARETGEIKECRHNACAVCLENMNREEDLEILNQCHHVFHPLCIEEVEKRSLMCPTCRNDTELSYTVNIVNKTVKTKWRKRDAPTLQKDSDDSFMETLNIINMIADNIGYEFSIVGSGNPSDNGGEMIMQARSRNPETNDQMRSYRRVNGRFELVEPAESNRQPRRHAQTQTQSQAQQRPSVYLSGMEPIRPRRIFPDPSEPPSRHRVLPLRNDRERERSPVRNQEGSVTGEQLVVDMLVSINNPSRIRWNQ